MRPIALVELNEVNLEFVRFYVERGSLPTLGRLIAEHGVSRTVSEQHYHHLEPWIQWVTAHTGKNFSEHGIFRLGDIVKHDIPQIWDMLEAAGLRVGAVSPMNAKHRLRKPAFFMPDPWTPTDITARPALTRLHAALAQGVNDNAQRRLTLASAVGLVRGMLAYARFGNYRRYMRLVLSSRKYPWRRSLFVDLLLADVFTKELQREAPQFASLFLNAGAHIQHHYMFSSAAYDGPLSNPSWYIRPGADPLFEAYEMYDNVIAGIMAACPGARVMLATGLHQVPHGQTTYYWRLKEHERFLKRVGASFATVEPRMSRDFVVRCADAASAQRTGQMLGGMRVDDGEVLFAVDNRGLDLFVELVYSREVSASTVVWSGTQQVVGFHNEVAFVALKNGEHDGIGYFVDSGVAKAYAPQEFALADLPHRILAAFGLGLDHTHSKS